MELSIERFVNNVRILAKAQGTLIGALEDQVHVSRGYFNKLVKRNSIPKLDTVCRISEVLGKSIDDLVFLDFSNLPVCNYDVFMDEIYNKTKMKDTVWVPTIIPGCKSLLLSPNDIATFGDEKCMFYRTNTLNNTSLLLFKLYGINSQKDFYLLYGFNLADDNKMISICNSLECSDFSAQKISSLYSLIKELDESPVSLLKTA